MPRLQLSPGGKKQKKRSVLSAASRGRLPSKRSINLAEVGIKKVNVRGVAVGFILIVLLSSLFGKFLVADRLAAMMRADGDVARLQMQLDQAYARNGSYEGLEDEYAHYTFSGMTEEELSLVNRSPVIRMIENEFNTEEAQNSWTLSGNILTITVTGRNLQEVNVLARRLEAYDIVNTCIVTNAVKEDAGKTGQSANIRNATGAAAEADNTIVRANIIAYLQEPEEDEESAEQSGGQP